MAINLSVLPTSFASATEKEYLLKTTALSPDVNRGEPNFWTSDLSGDAYVLFGGQSVVVHPGVSGAIAVTFTAPNDATLETPDGKSIKTYNNHSYTEMTGEAISDGARVSVFKNNQKLYPADDTYADITDSETSPTQINLGTITLKKEDKLRFLFECGGNGDNNCDAISFLDEFLYSDTVVTTKTTLNIVQGLFHFTETEGNANSGLGTYTKSQLVSYEYVDVLEEVDMSGIEDNQTEVVIIDQKSLYWSAIGDTEYWCEYETPTNVYTGTPYYYHSASGEHLIPGNNSAIAFAFTAPTNGTISNKFGLGSYRKIMEMDANSDQTRFSVVANGKIVYPSTGTWDIAPTVDQDYREIKFNNLQLNAGETIYYVVENGGKSNNSYDNINFNNLGFLWVDDNNPDGVWFSIRENFYTSLTADENSTIDGFKKSEVLSYVSIASVEPPIPTATEITVKQVEKIQSSNIEEMSFDTRHTKLNIKSDPNLLVRADCCQPSELHMLALQWTAPNDGRLRISSSYVNNFNYKTESQITDGSVSDGVRVKVILNDTNQIFPTGEKEWATTTANENLYLDVDTFAVEKGDTVLFIAECNKKEAYDTSVLKLVYDFAETGSGFTARYDSYNDTAKMFATADGTLDDTPWEYFAIMMEKDFEKYFGGNTHELPLVPVVLAGCASSFTGGNAIVITACFVLIVTVVVIRRRRFDK